MSYLKISVSYGTQSKELMLYYFIGKTNLIYKVIYFWEKDQNSTKSSFCSQTSTQGQKSQNSTQGVEFRV